ncbi:SDR family NAD(P)-dependent oxidoreductase [Streptomyces gobiensis]|uniref:SDR family NAD(P)-dependent oxidoreductase n=1 Tax=Streptomyces gobiensis TaxID=2875706 RepID=UPI001E4A9AE4|nr:SDR family NAD(P)-dependent oxidoreductase [Streptomyces gobiensis]UGY94772.1 SDR family NAD(P)-dependent oxidoreductase [Streptomyces gobiensis]
MRIKGRTAVVTGASGGIGRATAHALAARGAKVVVTARRPEALAAVVAECQARGAEALAVPADITDAQAVAEVARTAAERFGALDIWINCAAVTAFGPFDATPLEIHRRVLDVNVMGYVHGAHAALPYLRQRPNAVLVNVSSVVGVVAQPYTTAYTMSKFANRALGASLRQELRLENAGHIKVCSVLPASIDTPIFQQAANYTGRRVRPMPPVYRPQWAARTVVQVIRLPRHEVISGPAGRPLVLASKVAGAWVERRLAVIVDRKHLSRTEAAALGEGNLYEPTPGRGAVTGGWRARRRGR